MVKLCAMTSVCPDWSLDRIFDGMKRYGYKGLEPRLDWGHAAGIEVTLGPEEREKIKERFKNENLEVPCIATGARFAVPDEEEREKHIADTRSAVDLAADLGAPCVRTFGGPRGDAPVYWIVQRTAEAYLRVLDYAAERGVTVLMETHDDWCVSAQVRAVLERAGHPNLKALWDIMHPQRFMEKPEVTMLNVGAQTAHLHAHDGRYETAGGKMVICPLGEGVIDHAGPVRLLDEAGYDGYFSVEVIHKPGSEHDAESVLAQYAGGFRKIVQGG